MHERANTTKAAKRKKKKKFQQDRTEPATSQLKISGVFAKSGCIAHMLTHIICSVDTLFGQKYVDILTCF